MHRDFLGFRNGVYLEKWMIMCYFAFSLSISGDLSSAEDHAVQPRRPAVWRPGAGRIPGGTYSRSRQHAALVPSTLRQLWQFLANTSHVSLCWWIPVSVVDESLRLSPELFQQRYDVRAPGKDDHNIVFYCRSGNRSFKALSAAQQLGFHR